ncbi:MAG: pyruvate ferredoxin oxidoreductase, partial [Patescibacteria group bacterium]|nr:pyruvate ferredoxin oxidoreductase [Patescibacteria group bacterium]
MLKNAKILEGSRAVAEVINLINPAVVSAYPITPQTHIVEDLAKFKADGKANYEYVRAESEFAAASIVLGASATGLRTYSATSSQGLLLMAEVLFNIAGMRLPIVFTCANRGVSAPITIWNDHQDAMTVRDAGWLMFFAENLQEAVDLHLLAFKVAEKLRLPAMVNMDGFILTHTYEPVNIPTKSQVNKFLPNYKPKAGDYLDVKNPRSFGCFAAPSHYLEIREELHSDLKNSKDEIEIEFKKWQSIFNPKFKNLKLDNGLIEYSGAKKPEIIFVAMGSVVGTIKDFIEKSNDKIGILKIRTFRPFPKDEIIKILSKAKYVVVLDKSVSLGEEGILAAEIKSAAYNKIKTKIQSFIIGLGGR